MMQRSIKTFYSPLIIVFLLLTGCLYAEPTSEGTPVMLTRIKERIDKNLKTLDSRLFEAAGKIALMDADISNMRPVLANIKSSAPYIVNCAFVDKGGVIRQVEPLFSGAIGEDISFQGHISEMLSTRKPVMSPSFLAREGFCAVAIQCPVIKGTNFLGSVSALIRPEVLLGKIIENEINGVPVDAWVMQNDGKILYDKDADEIGKNLFEDDLYMPFPGLQGVGRKISARETGSAKYFFYAKGKKKKVMKNAYWATSGLYGAQWKIVLTTVSSDSTVPSGDLIQKGGMPIDQAIRKLAKDSELLDSVDVSDTMTVELVLKKFYRDYPCYSVQWVDEAGVNKVGYPAANSLINYRFDRSKGGRDAAFAGRVESKKECAFTDTLLEGNVGYFHMVPLFKEGVYMGMVYFIRIKPTAESTAY